MSQARKTETFYLTKDLSAQVKRLSDLKEEWQRAVAKLLLNKSLEPRSMAAEIHGLTARASSPSQGQSPEREETMRVTLEMLGKGVRGRARVLLHHLLPRVGLGDGDVVELADDGPTAPLIDVVKYFVSPVHIRVPPPERVNVLRQFFRLNHFPQSAFAPGRLNPSPSTPRPAVPAPSWISI